jgi:amidase
MKIATRDRVYLTHSKSNAPSISVDSGEVFVAETELCTGDWLRSTDDTWTMEKESGANPCVCVKIKGAKPGDMLCVEILDIALDNVGYTAFNGSDYDLPFQIHGRKWGSVANIVEISDGHVVWDEKTRIPVTPMIGTLGVAPEFESISNPYAGDHGGNMDVREVAVASKIYLPVAVNGALLHIGDVHALQGDGEINRGGLECRSRVTLKVDIMKKPKEMEWIRIEDEDYIMTVACLKTTEESFNCAVKEMMLWMCESYGFIDKDAYLLMGQLLEARCTQFVNPTRTYICKMPKKYLVK